MSSSPSSPLTRSPPGRPGRRARGRALAGLAVLAALIHVLLLDAAGGVGRTEAVRPGWRPMEVRRLAAGPVAPTISATGVAATQVAAAGAAAPQVEPAPAVKLAQTVTEAVGKPSRAGKATAKASARSQVAQAVAQSAPSETPILHAPERPPVDPAPSFRQASLEMSETDSSESSLPGLMKVALPEPRPVPALLAAGEAPPPVYRTVLPHPATLRYELRKGAFRGIGEIRWRPNGRSYALQFEARLAGLTLLSQSSQGELDANGLAPVRFLDQRPRKGARAVNFNRDSGTISFSGSTARWPLLAGSQDRLSWMIQLGGIVAANPALPGSGRISMVLVSSRGEAAVRTARFAGKEDIETASGSVPTLKFVVGGLSAYDDDFEIWLDPARGYLPARALSRSHTGEAEFELLLQRADP